MSIKVLDFELTREHKPIWGIASYNGLTLLVRYCGRPIGWAYLNGPFGTAVSVEQLHKAIVDRWGWELVLRVLGRGLHDTPSEGSRPSSQNPPVSVIICTRDRPRQLEQCLQALLALDYPEYEILVIDNASSNDETAQLVARLPVRYVREDRPGLDWARNRGIAEARYDIVAYTDDDARPDRGWLKAIVRNFEDPQVMAVTGLIAPAELETQAQIRFELHYGGMGRGMQRKVIKRSALNNWHLLWASNFGVGANMAFRRRVFDDIGSFDVALDVGTPSGGGGDNEMFHRLVAKGHTLVYEPEALVWHTHRRDAASFRQLVYNNGRSFGAYLLTCARNRTVSRSSILRFAIRRWLGRWILGRLRRPGKLSRRLVVHELKGALLSPLFYKVAQRRARQLANMETGPERA